MNPARGGWFILLSLFAAMVLMVVNLPGERPEWVRWLRPDWAVALFFFWTLAAPGRLGLVSAWLIGLLFDALLGASYPLGLHGAGFAFAIFVADRLRERLQMYSMFQQAGTVALIALAVQLAHGVVRFVGVDVEMTLYSALPAVTTMAAYPFLALALRAPVRRLFGARLES